MTNATAVREAVIAEIGDVLEIDAAGITPESRLIDLGAQSFDFVELVVRLEKKFAIRLPKELMIPDSHPVDRYVEAILDSTMRRAER